jgi:hypothetical protein
MKEENIKKYIVKLFDRSPFDKSDYIRDVQILCDVETGKPYAHLDSPHDWVGIELSQDDIKVENMNKRSKHLVPGDEVVFGQQQVLCGTIDKIVESEDDNWDDNFYLINCYNKYEGSELFEAFYSERPKKENVVKRGDTQHKNYLYAKISNDNVSWRKIEKEYGEFAKSNKATVEEVIKWWKERVDPKE